MSADDNETAEFQPQQQQNTVATVQKKCRRTAIVKEVCVPNANSVAAAAAQEISSTLTTLSTPAGDNADGAVLALFKQTEDIRRRLVSVTSKIDKISVVVDTLATEIYASEGKAGSVLLPSRRRFSTIAATLSNIGICGCCFGTIALVIIAMFVMFLALALIAMFGPQQY